jgi:hypothetical protein
MHAKHRVRRLDRRGQQERLVDRQRRQARAHHRLPGGAVERQQELDVARHVGQLPFAGLGVEDHARDRDGVIAGEVDDEVDRESSADIAGVDAEAASIGRQAVEEGRLILVDRAGRDRTETEGRDVEAAQEPIGERPTLRRSHRSGVSRRRQLGAR